MVLTLHFYHQAIPNLVDSQALADTILQKVGEIDSIEIL